MENKTKGWRVGQAIDNLTWEHAAVDKFRHYTGPRPKGY